MLLFLFAVIAIGFSFFCSIWEAVLLSIPPSYVHTKQREGTRTGDLLQEFKADIDRPLSAILSLNTIAHTLGALGVGATADAVYGSDNLVWFGYQMPFGAEAVIGFMMTLAILVLSEIIPKTLGATYWRQLAPFTVRSLHILTLILTPLVWMSAFITSRLKGKTEGSIFSRADFTAMADIGEESGVLKENEGRILRNLMQFETVEVEHVMTPRTVVRAAKMDLTIRSFYEEYGKLPFSRYPVFRVNRDQMDGYVLKTQVMQALIDGRGEESIETLCREIMHVNEHTPLHTLVDRLLEKQEQIALVVDNFGAMEGLVTMEDAIETLLGMEIVDEMDSEVDMQLLARENWKKRAARFNLEIPENTTTTLTNPVDPQDINK
ncbi:MAG: CNNM domain-containing protein [Saprospiraceae bacterium]